MSTRTPSKILPGHHYEVRHYTADDNALAQYFDLRQSVYRRFGMEYYQPEATYLDKHPDTVFILLQDADGTVHGGRRILVHQPNSDAPMKTDKTIPVSLKQMLQPLDIASLKFCEFTSLALEKPACGKGIAAEMYDVSFAFARAQDMAFIVAETVPTNIRAFVAAATRGGCLQIVPRPDVRSTDGDEDFRIFASFLSHENLPLLTADERKRGIGMPLSDARIDALIAYREALKKERLRL